MFDLLKLILKKEELQIALTGVAEPLKPNYRDNICNDCSHVCMSNCWDRCAQGCTGSAERPTPHKCGLLF